MRPAKPGPTKLTLIPAMPDEPAWGHFHRLALVNNATPEGLLRQKYGMYVPLREWPAPMGRVIRLLSWPPGRNPLYVLQHSLGYKLVSLEHCWDSHHKRRSQFFERSALHERAYLGKARGYAMACDSCVRSDIAQFGFSWFRRIHQVAGLEACPIHSEFLGRRMLRDDIPLAIPLQALGISDKKSADPSPNDAIPPEVCRYRALVDWLWTEPAGNKLRDLRRLAEIEGGRNLEVVGLVSAVVRAYELLASTPQTSDWFARNFQGFLERSHRWSPIESFYDYALVLACCDIHPSEMAAWLDERKSQPVSWRTLLPGPRNL